MLERAGIATASAELLLGRMRANVDDLCRERDALLKDGRHSNLSLVKANWWRGAMVIFAERHKRA